MAFSRLHEEHEVSPDLRRVYADIRSSFDLPFVPSLFKTLAASPEYLRAVWDDLGPVARSREFRSAATALDEFTRSLAVRGGWLYSDQEKVLASQKFTQSDVEALGTVISVFARALPRMVLFTRLLQRGYSGGQAGRVTGTKQAAALSRLFTLQVPTEKDAGLRVWLMYSDLKRTLNTKHVPSIFRLLSPFTGYLGSVWVDTKKLLSESTFQRSRDDIARRALGLVVGLPVRDHRQHARNVAPAQWREIEETVDSYARLLPPLALAVAVLDRSFPEHTRNFLAA